MKKLLFILFSFFIQFGFGQNWELFPYGQKSLYVDSIFQPGVLYQVFNDSMRTDGDTTIIFFNKKSPIPYLQECYDNMIEEGCMGYYQDYFYRDSIKYSNQEIIFNTPGIGKPFIFKQLAEPGDSWMYVTDYFLAAFDTVIVRCDSIKEEFIFGFTDSVKYFSFHPTETVDDDHGLETVIYRLSKNYGLLEFSSFYDLLTLNHYDDKFSDNYLIGFRKDTIDAGLFVPDWNDYFNYLPGDVRKWKNYGYLGGTSYRFDTIVEVTELPDLIKYKVKSGYEFEEVYYKSNLQYVLESPGSWLAFGPLYPFSSFNPDSTEITYLSTSDNEISIDTFGQTITKYFQSTWCTLFPGCLAMGAAEGGTDYAFNSRTGYVYFSHGSADNGTEYEHILVGAVMGGVSYGNTYPLDISDLSKAELILFPNPAQNLIQIDFRTTKSYLYTIFTFEGKIISTSELTTNQINIENLIPGIYILEIKNENEILHGKFIKQ